MHDGIEAFQIGHLDIADILLNIRYGRHPVAEGAIGKQITVETEHLVSFAEQHRHKHHTDVTFMTRDQDFHRLTSTLSKGHSPFPTDFRAISYRVTYPCIAKIQDACMP